MRSVEFPHSQSDIDKDLPAIDCDACESALQPNSQTDVSFLLLDNLTIPLISCEDHLAQFTSLCGLTTTETADLLHYQPAGGICCPGCRHAPHTMAQPMVPLQDGAVALIACPDHQAEIVQRYQTGLETRQQLTSGLPNSSQ